MEIIIIAWIILGIHGGYYFVSQFRKEFDFTTSEIPILIICVLLPIISHFATWMAFGEPFFNGKTIWKKKTKINHL